MVKSPPAKAGGKTHGFDPWVGKIPWRGAWQPTLAFLPGKSHGQKSLVDYSPKSRRQLDTTEVTALVHAHTHTHTHTHTQIQKLKVFRLASG